MLRHASMCTCKCTCTSMIWMTSGDAYPTLNRYRYRYRNRYRFFEVIPIRQGEATLKGSGFVQETPLCGEARPHHG